MVLVRLYSVSRLVCQRDLTFVNALDRQTITTQRKQAKVEPEQRSMFLNQ